MNEKFTDLSAEMQGIAYRMLSKQMEFTNRKWDLKKHIKSLSENGLIGEILESETYKKSFKKLMKDTYKRIDTMWDEKRFFKYNPLLVNQGYNCDEDGENWNYWYIFKAETEEEVINSIEKYGHDCGVYIEADEIHSAYDCTGQSFSWEMNISKVGKNLFLATKRYGLDV